MLRGVALHSYLCCVCICIVFYHGLCLLEKKVCVCVCVCVYVFVCVVGQMEDATNHVTGFSPSIQLNIKPE